MIDLIINLKFSDWASLFALLISAASLGTILYYKKEEKKKFNQKTRENVFQILTDAKNILENPPQNGFDYTPQVPSFNIDKLDECLSNKDAFSKDEIKLIKDAREILYKAKVLIDEVISLDHNLKGNVNFRGRFPKIKDECIDNIKTCLSIKLI